ncbi:MAG: hypothetical protein GXP13_08345 [Gammaproteobacteria bacterium]|nr:hypothetical protein [Gammaproteobacteria bacterium]
MRAIASYILKGMLQAILSASVPAVLSLSAPFMLKLLLIYFSGIVVALITLRMGPRQGFTVLFVSVIATVLAAQFMGLNNASGLDLWNTIYLWVLVWLGASVLQTSRSLVLMLEVVGLMGMLTILAFFVLVDNPIQTNMKLLQPIGVVLNHPDSGMNPTEVTTMINSAAKLLAGSVVTYTVLGVMICVFVARSWQAKLFNPGGFREEFITMRFGQKMGFLAIGLIVALTFSGALGQQISLMLMNISMVLGLLFVVAGLSVTHGLVALRENKGFWLVGIYALLIILSKIMAPFLMTLALSDIWADYRSRFRKN